MKPSVYLAGPIDGVSYEGCTDWREIAIEELAKSGIVGVSPMRDKLYSGDEITTDDYYKRVLSESRGIINRDRFDVLNCNLLLANFLGAEKVSIGTVMEIGWADLSRTPIIMVMEKEGNPHEHPMIREATGFRVETLESGLSVAKSILGVYS